MLYIMLSVFSLSHVDSAEFVKRKLAKGCLIVLKFKDLFSQLILKAAWAEYYKTMGQYQQYYNQQRT